MSSQGNAPTPHSALSGPDDTAVPWLLGAILVFAPLFRSGQPTLAVLVVEMLAVILLVLVLWRPRPNLVSRREALALVLLLAVPLLYLLPVPAGLAEWLPGREPYLAAQALLQGAGASQAASLSLYPLETESAMLRLLVPIAVFLAVRALDPHRLLQVVLLLLWLAAFQSLLGLLQYGAGEGSPQLLGMTAPDIPSAQGTYTNRNHLAGLLEMTLPIALALAIYSLGRERRVDQSGWRGRVAVLPSARGHAELLYGAIALLLLIGVIFTRSPAGIALSMLALLLSALAFARRIGGSNVYGLTGSLAAFAVVSGIAIGLVPVLDRFSAVGTIQDARRSVFSSTLDGIAAFSPVGSGPGSYPDVFPAFQPLALGRWFVNHAHNDYLEWLFEGGLLAAALILLLLFLYVRQWGRVWTRDEWSRVRFVQVAAGIGLLLLLLHSLVDYNLHIPANSAYFALLAGVFFSAPAAEAEPARRKRRGTPRLGETPAALPVPVTERPPVPPPDQIRNPFLD